MSKPNIHQLLSCTTEQHGQFYTCLIGIHAEAPPTVWIMGPYTTKQEAKWHETKWMRKNAKLERHGQRLQVAESASVREEIRAHITAGIRDELAKRGLPHGIEHLTPPVQH